MAAKFDLGRVVITRNAADVLPAGAVQMGLARHAAGDWGEVDPQDAAENELSLRNGLRLCPSIRRATRSFGSSPRRTGRRRLCCSRKTIEEVLKDMGWWRTGSGGVIGDGPADILEEAEGTIRVPEDIPIGLLSRIHEEYCREWDRNPTREELGELIGFCFGTKGG